MGDQGFLASLFDISFSSLITTKVIKVLYLLSMIIIGLLALVRAARDRDRDLPDHGDQRRARAAPARRHRAASPPPAPGSPGPVAGLS
jgi:hypothetical protein